MHKINVPCSVYYKVWKKFTCGFASLTQEKKQKKMLESLRYFLLHDDLHFKWWIMILTTLWVYARFRILFVYIFVPLDSLLRKTREPTHMEEKKKAQNEQSCITRITRSNLRRWSEMRTSRKTKWYKNLHKKNSKSCINPESGEYHHSSIKMEIIVQQKVS